MSTFFSMFGFCNLFILHLLLLVTPIEAGFFTDDCGTNGNYDANSTYQSNVNILLSNLVANGSSPGFATDVVGEVPDQIYGLVLCRGDLNATTCASCLNAARHDALGVCPYAKDPTIWYDECTLTFSNQLFLNSTRNRPQAWGANIENITDVDRFDKLVNVLMKAIADWAAYNSSKLFASGEIANFSAMYPTIYGMVQCTPDMDRSDCRACLQEFIYPIMQRLEGRKGARRLGVRCNTRYEVYQFYQGTSTLKLNFTMVDNATSPSQPPQAKDDAGRTKNVTGITLAFVLPLTGANLMLMFVLCMCLWRRKFFTRLPNETNLERTSTVESILIDLRTLTLATNNFSERNKLGEGGFFKTESTEGLILDGREIAVKKLSATSAQGLAELRNELLLVAKLQHRNLVRVIGVCLEEVKSVVYEYLPNRSLDTFLFDAAKAEKLNWGIRLRVIGGIARGLLYLHEESQLKIIHRDLKASNILLDAEMNPKISDFGLAKLFSSEQTRGATSKVVGTFGYMAPEYASQGYFSVKSDVFSFGVLVLEILTGKKNLGCVDSESSQNLLSHVWDKWKSKKLMEILDPTLSNNFPENELLRCAQIGLLCVQENPADRPMMSTVNVMLSSDPTSLETPSRPAFYLEKDPSLSKSTSISANENSVSELEPR